MQISAAQRRIYEVVEKAPDGDIPSRVFDFSIMGLVLVNVVAVILETVPSIAADHHVWFSRIEAIAVVVFLGEFLLRLFGAGAEPNFAGIRGRLRFLTTPLVVIDIIALVPFFMPMMLDVDAHAMQSLRLFRLLRLLKMSRYLHSMQVLGRVVKDRADQLMAAMFVVSILLVVASSLMYVVEHDAQPQVFSSIPMSMWWGVATLTTVGYGDIYPITPLGRMLGALMAVLGVGMFALPAGIIGSGFAEEIARQREAAKLTRCPHCHGDLDQAPKAEAQNEVKNEA